MTPNFAPDFGGLHPCTADFSGICTSHALYAALPSATSLPSGPTNRYSSATSATVYPYSSLAKQGLGFEISSASSTGPSSTSSIGWCCSTTPTQEMINAKEISFNVVKPLNVRTNPLPDHGSSSGPSINMISIAAIGDEDNVRETPIPFIINMLRRKLQLHPPRLSSRGNVANMEQEKSAMGITHSGRVYQGLEPADKGKAPAAAFPVVPEATPLPVKKVTEQEAKVFMKVIKVLTAAQVPKETTPDRIEKTVNSIFSNQISFAEDELPSEGQGHLRALHIICKCNNHVVDRVMINNGSTLNVCPVSTLKQMNVDMSHIRASKTTVRVFDGSRREVNGEIDLLIDVGPYSFSVIFQILEIPNAFSLLLERPWIHAVGAIPSSLHQKLKFFVEGKLITVNGEEDYAIYKEMTAPYISIRKYQNLPFLSFDTILVIQDYGEVGPSWADRMIRKVLLKNDYIPGTGLGACAQGILRPIEMEEYRNRRGLGFRPSCHEIVQARHGKHLHHLAAHYGKLSRGISVPPLS
ncbi:hypothetical protein CRG98_030963 [Punica granatum]|uniref:G-patch domain-containing protein n=1 Tax=Punica granatum TaxID=22663 RepID=A0A2I0IXH5_PUNGR|nr:hypothetical protein CRG98_030963 [Punica granatum]